MRRWLQRGEADEVAPVARRPRGATRLRSRRASVVAAESPPPRRPWVRRYVLWPFLMLLVLWGGWYLGQVLWPHANRPIAHIAIRGDLHYIRKDAVQQRIARFVERNFFDVDLVGMRQSLENMSLIAHAEIRRVWPDQIQIYLEEQVPVARWGDSALLNAQGQVFVSTELGNYEHLPVLSGPPQTQKQVMAQYRTLSEQLQPLEFSIERLVFQARGSWSLRTREGIELLLGRDDPTQKVRKLQIIYRKALADRRDEIARIDLRHAHGLAVAWYDPDPEKAAVTASRKK